ncbi:hypothetical protein DEO72_LG5g475 [Vigna unguiculata]|uniref:Uncharacterized protein n=1 Tax=Vigna unguiculata TaxID=3917 RepID=A0A4D6LVE5_VIGUN|nr:hypothetical protein DEO72_LG5g475 [Vigna unguiculata]
MYYTVGSQCPKIPIPDRVPIAELFSSEWLLLNLNSFSHRLRRWLETRVEIRPIENLGSNKSRGVPHKLHFVGEAPIQYFRTRLSSTDIGSLKPIVRCPGNSHSSLVAASAEAYAFSSVPFLARYPPQYRYHASLNSLRAWLRLPRRNAELSYSSEHPLMNLKPEDRKKAKGEGREGTNIWGAEPLLSPLSEYGTHSSYWLGMYTAVEATYKKRRSRYAFDHPDRLSQVMASTESLP